MKILALILALFCGITTTASVCNTSDCRAIISNQKQFDQLASKVKFGTLSMDVVKVVYLRDKMGNGFVHFINTRKYQYHYDFVSQYLKEPISEYDFNDNYIGTGLDRKFNLASLVRLPNSGAKKDQFLLEIWNGDSLSAKYMTELFRAVQGKLNLGHLSYHPLSATQEVMASKLKNIKVIKNSDIFSELDFIGLNEGEAVGYLKEVTDATTCLDHTSIALFSHIPNELGMVGGVITEEIQTPLSHVNVKSMNRGTVNASLKNARQVLRKYIGKPVRLVVRGGDYKITELPRSTADQIIADFWKRRKPNLTFNLKPDLTPSKKFLNLENLFPTTPTRAQHSKLSQKIGAKAANIAILNTLAKNSPRDPMLKYQVPKGSGVPFSFFESFMNFKQPGLDKQNPLAIHSPAEIVEKILKKNALISASAVSICKAKPVLAKIRNVILRAQVPDAILDEFRRILLIDSTSAIHQKKVARVRLRSSTNSEDLDGFTGAGLYNSAGVWLYDKDSNGVRSSKKPSTWKKIKKRLKKKIPYVYSSVWNDRAFEEREWYGMNGQNHLKIKVGIAVHRAFPFKDLDNATGEVANGVAITTNVFDSEQFYKLYINSQFLDLSVTNPPTESELKSRFPTASRSGYSTEELLVTTFVADPVVNAKPDAWKSWSYEVLGRSSLDQSQSVLRDVADEKKDMFQMEARRLARVLTTLKHRFARVYRKLPDTFALDVEWKLIGDTREIWIKQARPFAKPRKDLAPRNGRSFQPNKMLQPGFVQRGPRVPLKTGP